MKQTEDVETGRSTGDHGKAGRLRLTGHLARSTSTEPEEPAGRDGKKRSLAHTP